MTDNTIDEQGASATPDKAKQSSVSKPVTIVEARKRLKAELGDSEGYHGEFDRILEEKLAELDPEFMKALNKLYDASGESRWYA